MDNHSISIKSKTPSQRERILARLRKGSVTSWELAQMGIYQSRRETDRNR